MIIMCGIIIWACCISLHGNLNYLYTSIKWNYLARCEVANMVVKIAFWLVKSYDFTSQNMHYGLNRLKKSKMDKIGLKSGEIAKIGWNRAKSWFQGWFYDFDKIRCWNKIPPSCPTVFTFFQPIWSLDFNFLAMFLCMSSKL